MADPEQKQQEEEEELIPVGEGVEDEQEEELEEEEEQEERLGASEDEEEEDDGKAEKLAKRRDERKTRKQRQREARQRDATEMNFLRNRNETLERERSQQIASLDQRIGHSEVAAVDTRINDVKGKIKLADQVIAKAISQQDGESYTEAQSIRDNLRDNLSQLEGAKQYMSRERQPPQQQQAPDPRLMQHASSWMHDHDWWDPNGRDEDSRKVSSLDAQLITEGLDPTTQEYWDTLSDRVEDALPHRFGNGKEKTPRKKGGGPTFRTGGRERPLKKGEVYISPDRRQAMEEAGVWEDPILRKKYLASYAKYDSENRS